MRREPADHKHVICTKILVSCVKGRVLAEEHPDRLASQHALAGAYHADGQTKKAVELLEHVVAVKSVVYRKDHPSRLVSESVLNYLLAEQLDNLHMSELQKDGI
jgi:hypothetical protein